MCVKIINDREYFYQYDINQKMVVCDRNVKELHFTNEVLNVAYVRDIYDAENIRLCDIPNIILTYGGYLKVYACYEDYTQKEYTFIVNERNKPEDYVDEEYNERFILLTDRVGYLEKKTDRLESDFEQLSEAIQNNGDGTKYLSDDGTYKTIVVEQSDYAENDETSPAYIKNRPIHVLKSDCKVFHDTVANEVYSNTDESYYDFLISGWGYSISADIITSTTGLYTVEINAGAYNDVFVMNGGQVVNNLNGATYLICEDNPDVYFYESALDALGLCVPVDIVNQFTDAPTFTIRYYETGVLPATHVSDEYLEVFQSDYNETDETSPRYIHNKPNFTLAPYVIDSEAYTYGDDALQAILDGRQIYIKVPNADGGTIFTNYMPVVQYQLPTGGNNYLVLIYMHDGIATNIMTALSTGDFSGVYGQIVMALSQQYDTSPLAIDPVK